MRLIDADALKMEDFRHCLDCDSIIQVIKFAPTIEAELVKHGQWVDKKEWHLGRWVSWYECSCCGEKDENYEMYETMPFCGGLSNYCPNCGAKMKGAGNNG